MAAQGPVIGIALDGTGYGPDGTIWGGEVLIASVRDYERVAHLEALPLPGGEVAIRRPYRIAWGYVWETLGEIPQIPTLSRISHVNPQEQALVIQQVQRRLNAPLTSSAGRLFDAVSALLGLCPVTTFEAQAAIALELAAREADLDAARPYPFDLGADGILRLRPLLAALVEDVRHSRAVSAIAADFHVTLAEMVAAAAAQARDRSGLDVAALSGGVFQNRLLLRLTRARLRAAGFEVLTHQQVPANDGGLSLGQAVIGLHRLA